ncbi:MAG: excinuclease ABC subunit UvrB, partial [Fibrobacterota bacterium]
YDYYQPEAYLPQTDTFIEKDSSRNDEIDRLRLKATTSLFSRRDVIIVASVSCIYGLGSPKEYVKSMLRLERGTDPGPEAVMRRLVDIQYARNDIAFEHGAFRLRGDTLDIYLAYDARVLRVEFFGDTIERLSYLHPLTLSVQEEVPAAPVFPATHFVATPESAEAALNRMATELDAQLETFTKAGQLLEAQRLKSRTHYDMEMIREIGYCSGIENYSRIFDGRAAGTPPYTLLDYFPKDYLVFADESHVMLPQIRGMFNGDRARKTVLVEHGFRLPCALDNRPLTFEEFEARVPQTVYVSATPAEYELAKSQGVVAEQLVRPTGLLDPQVLVLPAARQVDDLLERIRERLACKERVLVTTLTKKMAEDLTTYFGNAGVPVRYLHSDIQTLERAEIIRDFRLGTFEVLVGINLLREGLDLPEVSLVAILDADKEGFLRSERSLIQTMGRASRNVNGTVILYADTRTPSMERAIAETNRRRSRQEEYNRAHGITPRTIVRKVADALPAGGRKDGRKEKAAFMAVIDIDYLTDLMNVAASELEFEKAAKIRDRIRELTQQSKARDD